MRNLDVMEVMLAALCYSLEQAYSSTISIIIRDSEQTDEVLLWQLKQLVSAIDTALEVIDLPINPVLGYDEDLINLIKQATTLADCYSK